MKISQLSTDKAADVLIQLVPCITSIISDPKILNEFKETAVVKKDNGEIDYMAIGIKKINDILPYLLEAKREELFTIVGALNDKTVKEIKEQNILLTVQQVYEMAKDKELIDFFKSCGVMAGSE